MSCSGGNRLKQSTHVCWKGSYKGKQYTAYNYACYPTQGKFSHYLRKNPLIQTLFTSSLLTLVPPLDLNAAPKGHDPSKCKEDGKKDDDCCALKGHESCASGFRVQRSNHACFKDAKFTAYNYYCT